jgi:hypothetical protein
MPEPLDFDQIARRLIALTDTLDSEGFAPGERDQQSFAALVAGMAEQLRQVWNARGAADLAALEPIIEKLGDTMHPDNARAFVTECLSDQPCRRFSL